MKHLCSLLVVLSISTFSLFGQDEDLYEKYSQKDGVESFVLSRAMVKLASLSLKGNEKEVLKGIDKIKILDFEKATQSVRLSYLEELSIFKTLVSVSDDIKGNERTVCYAAYDSDVISKMIIITIGVNDTSFRSMELLGTISFATLQKFASDKSAIFP